MVRVSQVNPLLPKLLLVVGGAYHSNRNVTRIDTSWVIIPKKRAFHMKGGQNDHTGWGSGGQCAGSYQLTAAGEDSRLCSLEHGDVVQTDLVYLTA